MALERSGYIYLTIYAKGLKETTVGIALTGSHCQRQWHELDLYVRLL